MVHYGWRSAAALVTGGSHGRWRHVSAAMLVVALTSAVGFVSCQRSTAPDSRGGWYQQQPGFANARPALYDSLVIAGNASGSLIARSRRTGDVVWRSQVPVYLRIRGAELTTSGDVLVVPVDYQTVGVDARTGAVLWQFEAPLDSLAPQGTSPLPGSVIAVYPAADSSTTYLPAMGGSVSALDSRSGRVKWQWVARDSVPRRFGARGIALDGPRVIATAWHHLNTTGTQCEGWVIALDRATGAQLWRTVVPSRSVGVCLPGRPAVGKGRVVVTTIDGYVYGLDAATGNVVWRREPEQPSAGVFNAILTSAVAVGDIAIVDAGTSHVLALRLIDGALVWRSAYGGDLPGELKHDAFATASRFYAPDGKFLYVFDLTRGRFLTTLLQPNGGSDGLFPSSVVADSERVYAPVNGGLWAFPSP